MKKVYHQTTDESPSRAYLVCKDGNLGLLYWPQGDISDQDSCGCLVLCSYLQETHRGLQLWHESGDNYINLTDKCGKKLEKLLQIL